MGKRIQVLMCTKYNYPATIYNCATTEYIHSAIKYTHPTASDCNYIPGCLDLQWRTTLDARVYLLVQWGHLCGFFSSSVRLSAPGRFGHIFLCTDNVLDSANNLLQCLHGSFPMVCTLLCSLSFDLVRYALPQMLHLLTLSELEWSLIWIFKV